MRKALALAFLLSISATAVRPGWLGLGFTSHREGKEQWLVVRFVVPGSPAERAGFQPNDVVTRIDGKPLAFRDDFDLLQSLGRFQPGQRIRFTILVRQQRLTREVIAVPMTEEQFRRYTLNVEVARLNARQP